MAIEAAAQTDRFAEIEAIVTDIQRKMWRSAVPKGALPVDPVSILNPATALEARGFRVRSAESLGTFVDQGRTVEVAGLVDFQNKVVSVSRKFDRPIQLFTLSHEYAHVVLGHRASGGVLHRDRPLTGPSERRTYTEREADWFAACLLMPAKVVREKFADKFCADQFLLNEDTAFHLCMSPLSEVRKRFRSKRDLSLTLATAISYGAGRHFMSLAHYFGVSPMAMAFRLEQLGLVDEL